MRVAEDCQSVMSLVCIQGTVATHELTLSALRSASEIKEHRCEGSSCSINDRRTNDNRGDH